MTSLRLAANLTLPPEAVTETFAILAKRGVGKTYTASVLTEEMLRVGAQVVVLDPLDAWWGLRSSADGKGDGLPIYCFGGEHGDLPLEADHGAQLADVVVDEGISAIFSLRHLSKTRQRTFVTAFAERLYHRKGEPAHRTPLHVMIDEADAFVPQRVSGDVAPSVGAIDDLVRRGRSSGIGVTLISQRAAVVNKDVLTQAEVLIALRTVSPQDRKALEAWVEAHGAEEQRAEFFGSLAGLAVGEAWVWSPGWLDVFQRVRIRERTTFDSSATPKAGARPAQPKARATVDLDALRTKLAASVERSRANDPKALKARIAELERAAAVKPEPEVRVERVEVPVLNGEVDDLRELIGQMRAVSDSLTAVGSRIADAIFALGAAPVPPPAPVRAPRPAPAARPTAPADTPVKLGRAERAILGVLAQRDSATVRQVGLLTGYSPKGGGFRNALGALRSAGLISGGQLLTITPAGRAMVPDVEPLPTGEALLEVWLGHSALGRAERAILEALWRAYPATMTQEQVADATGYAPDGGGFRNALGRLRTLELITGGRTDLRCADELC